MFLTEYLRLPMGHDCIDFVDIRTDSDTELFIDPCLIELGTDARSRYAYGIFRDFADTLFAEMRSQQWATTSLLDDGHEVNAIKLGYGNGRNGKGKTADGLSDCFNGLKQLANGIPSISQIQDLSVFIQDFAEDSMSDLLANLLHRVLCNFTQEQMMKYGVPANCTQQVRSWDPIRHSWMVTQDPCWLCEGHPILLVPKQWVRPNFLFSAHQYLCCIIIDRLQRTPEYTGLSKKDIYAQLSRTTYHWEYDRAIRETVEFPDLLLEYHRRMLSFYKRKGGILTDDDLDQIVYHRTFSDQAG